MKRFLGFLCLSLVLLAILAPKAALAEEKKDYAYYEYEFGIKLIKFNFWALAEQHFNNYLKDPKIPADARTRGYLGLAILYKNRGRNAKASPKEREEAFDKALANLNEFLQKWPDKNSPDYRSAEGEKYGIEIDRVEAKILEIETIPVSDESRKGKEEAARIKLREAITKLAQIHDSIRDERAKFEETWFEKNPDDEWVEFPEEMDDRWFSIGYALARSYYLYPRIYVSGTDDFKKAIEFALNGLNDFVWEHSTDTVYIHGGMYLARLLAGMFAMTKVPEERETLRGKIDKTFQEYVFNFEPDAFQYLRELAFNEYAQILVELGYSDEILVKVWTKYITDYPNWIDETQYGQGYILASRVALVMLENNQAAQAVDILAKVIEKANLRNLSEAASIASKNLATIIERLGPETMDTVTLLQAGNGFKGKGDWASAITYYQYVIQGLDKRLDEEEMKKLDHKTRTEVQKKFDDFQKIKTDIGIEAFQSISECFVAVGMRLEAIISANEVLNRYSAKNAVDKDKAQKTMLRAANTAYNVSREVFFEEYRRGVSSRDTGELYITALKNYEKFDPTKKDAMTYDLAQVKQMFADYLEAIELYKKIPDAHSQYANAQYNICVCYVRLSQDADAKGDAEGKAKFQVAAIDSLNAVINMDRKWGPADGSKQISWERRRSACFKLLADIYNRQNMNAELVALAEKWMTMYADKIAKDETYRADGDGIMRVAINAAIAMSDPAKADQLYMTVKDKVLLLGKTTDVAPGKKYDVAEEEGAPYVEICLKLGTAYGTANNADRQKFFTAEADKWSGGNKSIGELYNELARFKKTPDIYVRKLKELLSKLEAQIEKYPLKRDEMLSDAYIKTIYFTGDKKKSDDMTAAYREFIDVFVGGRGKRINYYDAKKKMDALKAFDPNKTLELWRQPMMKDIERVVDYYYMRLRSYNDSWEITMKAEDHELSATMLEYLIDYYRGKDELLINGAISMRKIKRFEKAIEYYGTLINDRRKDSSQCEYRFLAAITYFEIATSAESAKAKQDAIDSGLSQLGYIEKVYPDKYDDKMRDLRTKFEALK